MINSNEMLAVIRQRLSLWRDITDKSQRPDLTAEARIAELESLLSRFLEEEDNRSIKL